MQFDGNHPDTFSRAGLIAWLETQDPATMYDWDDCHGECLMGRYGIAMGLGEDWRRLHNFFYARGLLGPIALKVPWTYGAALKRARQAA